MDLISSSRYMPDQLQKMLDILAVTLPYNRPKDEEEEEDV
jgi:hypothetical protein